MRVGIGVPVLNNFKGFAELMASLSGSEFTLYVESNWIKNIGVSKSWNSFLLKGMDDELDLLIICNDDVVFNNDTFFELTRDWAIKPADTILVSATTGQREWKFGEAPDYSCFAFNPEEMHETVGLFDENFTPAYFEDNDSHYRINLANKKAMYWGYAQIKHKGSQTQNAIPDKPIVTSEMFENNRSYYKEKWGGQPGTETWTTPFNDKSKTLKDW